MLRLTGQDGGHQGSKHEEQHGEKEETSVVEDLAGIISDIEIKQANQHSNTNMGHHPEVGQHLETKKINNNKKPLIDVRSQTKHVSHSKLCL